MTTPPFDSLALVRTALGDLWEARRLHVILSLVAILPRTILEFTGALTPYYDGFMAETLPPGYWQATLLLFLWAALWNTPMLVLWYRRFLVGPEEMLRLRLGELAERTALFLLYGFLLTLLVGGALLLLMVVLGGVLSIVSGGHSGTMLPLGLMVMVALGLFFFLGARLILTFAAIPIGRRVSFRESWQRTLGIAGPVIGAVALCAMGGLLVSQSARWLLSLPFIGAEGLAPGVDIPPVLHLVDFVLAPLNYAATALIAAVTAEVYRALSGPPLDAHGLEA